MKTINYLFCLFPFLAISQNQSEHPQWLWGVEVGLAGNDWAGEVIGPVAFPTDDIGIIAGARFRYYVQPSIFSLGTGLIYQKKGIKRAEGLNSLRSDNLLIPLDLNFHFGAKNKWCPYISIGTYANLFLQKKSISSFTEKHQRFSPGLRYEIGLSTRLKGKSQIEFALKRAINKTYEGLWTSRGGNISTIAYKNVSFGLVLRYNRVKYRL